MMIAFRRMTACSAALLSAMTMMQQLNVACSFPSTTSSSWSSEAITKSQRASLAAAKAAAAVAAPQPMLLSSSVQDHDFAATLLETSAATTTTTTTQGYQAFYTVFFSTAAKGCPYQPVGRSRFTCGDGLSAQLSMMDVPGYEPKYGYPDGGEPQHGAVDVYPQRPLSDDNGIDGRQAVVIFQCEGRTKQDVRAYVKVYGEEGDTDNMNCGEDGGVFSLLSVHVHCEECVSTGTNCCESLDALDHDLCLLKCDPQSLYEPEVDGCFEADFASLKGFSASVTDTACAVPAQVTVPVVSKPEPAPTPKKGNNKTKNKNGEGKCLFRLKKACRCGAAGNNSNKLNKRTQRCANRVTQKNASCEKLGRKARRRVKSRFSNSCRK